MAKNNRKNRNPPKSIPKSRLQNSINWLKSNLYWTVPLIIGVLWVNHKHVEADLTVTHIKIVSESPTKRDYLITFKINNSGTLPITIYNATPYIRSREPDMPLMSLLENEKEEEFKDKTIDAQSFKEFSIHAYVDKSFIESSMDAEEEFKETYELPEGKTFGASMNIQIGVIIYGNDKKYKIASSEPIKIFFKQGKQIEFSPGLTPVNFKDVDIDTPIHIRFDEPK